MKVSSGSSLGHCGVSRAKEEVGREERGLLGEERRRNDRRWDKGKRGKRGRGSSYSGRDIHMKLTTFL